ncbi:MAG: hypothetical protein L0287_34665 [Anaerolineae bacterium]|nr:hypothetical protein [Anaerolineae bacterium]
MNIKYLIPATTIAVAFVAAASYVLVHRYEIYGDPGEAWRLNVLTGELTYYQGEAFESDACQQEAEW